IVAVFVNQLGGRAGSSGDNVLDDYATLADVGGVLIGGTVYESVQVEYYCEDSACTLDPDNDGVVDCAFANGSRATTLTAIDAANNCIYADFAVGIDTFTFGLRAPFDVYDNDGNGYIDAPVEEIDTDGDTYVECPDSSGYDGTDWKGSTAEPEIGQDCDPNDQTVFPDADEVCDGQYNNCSDGTYSVTGAPDNELDEDGDGWVACERNLSYEWQGATAEPNLWFGSEANDCWCPSESICTDAVADGAGAVGNHRCLEDTPSSAGTTNAMCIPNDCDSTASSGEGDPAFSDIVSQSLTDCDDDDIQTFPGAAPMEGDTASREGSTVMANVAGYLCMNDTDNDFYGDALVSDPITVGSDCDDNNAEVFPFQEENCEFDTQIDDDCNGDVNSADGYTVLLDWDSAIHPLLFVDEDNDSFGDPSIGTIRACELVDGYSNSGRDCDDSDALIYPGADEICDQVDQDCDLAVDEPDLNPDTSGCLTLFRDQDNDGYGDTSVSECLCLFGTATSTTNPDDGDKTYVLNGGDCYDFDSTIKPLTCEDNTDNDGDGRIDEDDEDCINGLDENGIAAEDKIEIIDGHDNDCDGFIPAIELDCDDDNYMAILPPEDTDQFSNGENYTDYGDVGLAVCGSVSGAVRNITCWDQQIRVECDAPVLEVDSTGTIRVSGSGLWQLPYTESEDGFGGRFNGGHREWTSGVDDLRTGDCDDQCILRFPDFPGGEECDGIDNDCSDVNPGTDDDGIPDSLDDDVVIAGTISAAEFDIDDDGFLACDDLPSITTQNQYSDNNCDIAFTTDSNDCEIFCSLTNPLGVSGEERCDGFLNVCDSADDLEGLADGDRDNYMTCGAFGSDASSLDSEDLYVVVWLKDVDWARRSSEAVELSRTSKDADAQVSAAEVGASPSHNGTSATTVGSEPPPPPGVDSGMIGVDTGDSGAVVDTADDGSGDDDGSVSTTVELEDMVPLLMPRTQNGSVIECDADLREQMQLLLGGESNDRTLGASRLEAALDFGNGSQADRQEAARILLEACQRSDGFCSVVQLTLDDDADLRTEEDYLNLPGALDEDCEDRPEQYISRAVWQRERILEARQTLIEWECQRLFGSDCSEFDIDDETLDSAFVPTTDMPNPDQWLSAVDTWWKELDRYQVASGHEETYLTCWGDPTASTNDISDQTGGDCDDSDETGRQANRDIPEGPGDLLGLYLNAPADCSTCLDGIDNNCDGNIDCADPACARCFVGQGVGCSRGDDAPCAQAGCAIATPQGGAFLDRLFAAALLSLFAVLYRRRERR
ncbi:MAG: putative metal-binding motif-containing protein, partial [Myxococcota bacterium]